MSGETESHPSGWTLDSLHSHLIRMLVEMDRRYEQRFEAQEKATVAALTAAKEAVTKAETAAEKRFDSVNEFRAALADQQNTFVTRTEWDGKHIALSEKVDAQVRNTHERIADVISRVDLIQGRSTGIEGAWGYLIGAAGLVAALIAVVIGVR